MPDYVIHANPDDLGFAKTAMSAPGLVPDDVDLVLGRTDLPDGTSADVRLRGMGDGEPAHLCAAIFTKRGLVDYVDAEDYEELFVLRYGGCEREVRVVPDPSAPPVRGLLDRSSAS